MLNDLITTPNLCLANSSFLRDYFKAYNVPVYLEHRSKEIRDGCVIVTDKDGHDKEIACESVILSVGYDPAPLASPGKNVYIVGDAGKVGNLRSAIWGAWKTAMKI